MTRSSKDILHDSLALADLALYVGDDDRRQACDQIKERLRQLVAEIDAQAAPMGIPHAPMGRALP